MNSFEVLKYPIIAFEFVHECFTGIMKKRKLFIVAPKASAYILAKVVFPLPGIPDSSTIGFARNDCINYFIVSMLYVYPCDKMYCCILFGLLSSPS